MSPSGLLFDETNNINPGTGDPQYVTQSSEFNFNPSVDFTANTAQITAVTETLAAVEDDSVSYYAVTNGVNGGDREVVFIYRNANVGSTNGGGGAGLNGFVGLELNGAVYVDDEGTCLLYTSPSPRDRTRSRMPSSA